MSRRHQGEGSIYQRADGRWVGVVDLGWVGGKRVRKTVTASTLAELRPKFKKLKGTLDAGVEPDAQTVEQWMNYWLLKIAAKENRASTMDTYRRYIVRWVIPHLGKRRLDRLKPEHIEALYDAMEAAGLADASRRQVHAIVRRSLRVAVQRRKIPYNPAESVVPPPVGKGSHGKLTLDEAKLILRSAGDAVERARVCVALLAGLRRGEALGLRWECVDFEADYLHVEQAVQRITGAGLQVVDLKSAAAHRDVPMVAPVRAALWAIRQDSGYVFGKGESPRSPEDDSRAWRVRASGLGIERSLHAARATTGSLLMEAGVDPVIIAEILGHAQVTTTQRHYLHGDERTRRSAMGALDELVRDDDA